MKGNATSSLRANLRRAWRLGAFAGLQALAQGLSVLAGLIVIRTLAGEEYAVYAVVGALIGVTGTTCDLGAGGALVAFLGKAHSASERLTVIATVDRLRRTLTLGSAAIAVLLLGVHPATSADASLWLTLATLSALVIYAQSRTQFLRLVAASDGRLQTIGRSEVVAAAARLAALLLAFVVFGLASIYTALVAWLTGTIMALWLLRHVPARRGTPNSQMRKAVFDYARPLWFGHAYHVASSLLPLFGLGFGAGAVAVAEFAALGRLGQITTVVSPLLGYVMMPYVARGVFRHRAPIAVVGMLLAAAAILFLGYIAPGPLLWVIGDRYRHLEAYVPLALAAAALGMLSGGLHQLILAGAHTSYQWVAVIAGIAAQAALLSTAPPVDLASAFAFVLITKTAVLIAYGFLMVRALAIEGRRPRQSLGDLVSGR